MELTQWLLLALEIIGGATLVLNGAIKISEKTVSNWDNKLVEKLKLKIILDFIISVSKTFSLNVDSEKVIIKMK